MDEAPNEGPFPFYYREAVDCLAYLQANPGFKGHMNYMPVEQYADTAMTNRVYSRFGTSCLPHAKISSSAHLQRRGLGQDAENWQDL
jgi:hypothetical protein